VYIFDLPALNAAKTINDLKTILNSDSHLKIVYDSRNIVENFKVKFGFELKPVFDVLLSAAQFFRKQDVLELGSCIKSVLGIEVDIMNDEVIKQRPLSSNQLLAFANKSGFLLSIYHKLSAKSFSIMFQNNLDQSKEDTEKFFDGLGLTKIEKLENLSQPLELKEIDFSIYENRD
jgi:ribonuclease D